MKPYSEEQLAELERIRSWACCLEPERRFLAEIRSASLRTCLTVVLDCVDYTAGNCRVNEMVGAVLPKEIIEQARNILLTGS